MSFILYKHKMSQDVSTLTHRKRKRGRKSLKLSVICIRSHSHENFRGRPPARGRIRTAKRVRQRARKSGRKERTRTRGKEGAERIEKNVGKGGSTKQKSPRRQTGKEQREQPENRKRTLLKAEKTSGNKTACLLAGHPERRPPEKPWQPLFPGRKKGFLTASFTPFHPLVSRACKVI